MTYREHRNAMAMRVRKSMPVLATVLLIAAGSGGSLLPLTVALSTDGPEHNVDGASSNVSPSAAFLDSANFYPESPREAVTFVAMNSCDELLPDSTISAMVTHAYQAATNYSDNWPSQSVIVDRIARMFVALCLNGTFATLASQWGNLSVTLTSDPQGPQETQFTITWISWQSATQYWNSASWNGNLSSNILSGPLLSQVQCPCPSYTPPSTESDKAAWLWPVLIAVLALVAVAIGALVLAISMRRPKSK